jgi:hypothetical protein
MVSSSIGCVSQLAENVRITSSEMVVESKAITKASIPGKVDFAGRKASENSRMSCVPLDINHTKAGRQVNFGHVQIRRYSMTIGDNPSCRAGAPVSLDWQYEELPVLSLDEFEATRALTRKPNLHHLFLGYYQRKEILLKSGYSKGELKQAEKEAAKVQRQRSRTQVLWPISKIEELAQSARRKVMRRFQVQARAA